MVVLTVTSTNSTLCPPLIIASSIELCAHLSSPVWTRHCVQQNHLEMCMFYVAKYFVLDVSRPFCCALRQHVPAVWKWAMSCALIAIHCSWAIGIQRRVNAKDSLRLSLHDVVCAECIFANVNFQCCPVATLQLLQCHSVKRKWLTCWEAYWQEL